MSSSPIKKSPTSTSMKSINFFDDMKMSFADVPTDGGIATEIFCQAVESLIKLFDVMGSAFIVVKNDMAGNVVKIRAKLKDNPTAYATLQAIVAEGKKSSAAEGLLWLDRGLEYTAVALRRSLTDKAEELAVSFTKAYETTLSLHHGFFVRTAFSMAMKAVPKRDKFYGNLGSDQEKMLEQFQVWLNGLEKIHAILKPLFAKW